MNVLRSKFFRLAFASSAVFFAAVFLLPAEIIIQIMNGVVMSIGAAVAISFMPDVWDRLKGDDTDEVSQMIIGIALSWFGAACLRVWANGVRIFDLEWMRNSNFISFFLFVIALGGILHLTAPGAIEGRVPKKNWLVIGISVGIGMFIAGVLVGIGVDAFKQL